eukprot:Protomagalhaensia_sp_Gyna_25__794@NODE_1382_length_1893_cov_72_333333_g1111_i0_p1_GENE_NODE_1382_length_1893_cov_72_333333_g1111_i0NODE_1382_length_1893_cov_72_333333_g1111_i0_p1_ORF_typecomplete_len265_score13_85FYTT/PF07078_11/0_17FYTT/PF07078_11/4e03_NODE_1382_length_1893_cov_72_333333_g1111_i010981835
MNLDVPLDDLIKSGRGPQPPRRRRSAPKPETTSNKPTVSRERGAIGARKDPFAVSLDSIIAAQRNRTRSAPPRPATTTRRQPAPRAVVKTGSKYSTKGLNQMPFLRRPNGGRWPPTRQQEQQPSHPVMAARRTTNKSNLSVNRRLAARTVSQAIRFSHRNSNQAIGFGRNQVLHRNTSTGVMTAGTPRRSIAFQRQNNSNWSSGLAVGPGGRVEESMPYNTGLPQAAAAIYRQHVEPSSMYKSRF